MPNMGTTSATVEAAFGANIAKFMVSNTAIATQLAPANITPFIARLSTDLAYYDKAGGTAALLKAVAMHRTAADLRFYQSAFGPTLVNTALAYAPATIKAQYLALPAAAPLVMSQYYYSSKGITVAPTVTAGPAYLMDLYMEIYFYESDTWITAMHKTQQYATAVIPSAGFLDVLQASQPTPPGVT